jgi:hypothetical protein
MMTQDKAKTILQPRSRKFRKLQVGLLPKSVSLFPRFPRVFNLTLHA